MGRPVRRGRFTRHGEGLTVGDVGIVAAGCHHGVPADGRLRRDRQRHSERVGWGLPQRAVTVPEQLNGVGPARESGPRCVSCEPRDPFPVSSVRVGLGSATTVNVAEADAFVLPHDAVTMCEPVEASAGTAKGCRFRRWQAQAAGRPTGTSSRGTPRSPPLRP